MSRRVPRLPRASSQGAIAGCLALILTLVSCARVEKPRANLILVTLDTTRADRLGCYGHEPARTPHLDSLATRGVLFEQAVASAPITLPSHATILTGASPVEHGVRDNGLFALPETFDTIAEILHREGFQTGAFVSAFVLDRAFGTDQGFTTYDDWFDGERSALLTSRKVVRWVEKLDRDRPFFLWVHYYDPHLPWRPPEPFRSMTELEPYDQEIAAMDAGLGWLLGKLGELGLLERTDILIVGDHGEGLGDHGEIQHGTFLYDNTVLVPMILVTHDGRWAGRRMSQLVSTADVTPTLADLAGVSVPEDPDGTSLLPLLERGAASVRESAYCETYYPAHSFYHSQIYALRTNRWKYIAAPRPELYHLGRDPGETRNLIRAFPDTAHALQERLARIREASGTGAQASRTLSPEELERLQSLGYLGGGGLALEIETSGEFVLPDPKDLIPYLESFDRGLMAQSDGRFEEAELHLRRVIENNPENVIAHMNLGRVLMRLQKFEEAFGHFEEASILAPKSATCTRLVGLGHQVLGRYEEAIAVFRKIADDPLHGEGAQKEIARTQLLMGRPEEALVTLRNMGLLYADLARLVSSYIEARDSVEENPEDQEARLELAGLALDLRLLDEAQAALRFRGSSPILEARRRRTLGSIAVARGDLPQAREEFERALSVLGRDAYICSHLVGLYIDAGELDRALAMAEELIREGQADHRVYYNKACALALQGKGEEALAALRRAVKRGYDDLRQLNEDPDLESLRKDPRFVDIMGLVGEVAGP